MSDEDEKIYVGGYKVENEYEQFYTTNEAMKDRLELYKKYDCLSNLFWRLFSIILIISFTILGSTSAFYQSPIWIISLVIVVVIESLILALASITTSIKTKLECKNFYTQTEEFDIQYKEYADKHKKDREQKTHDKAKYLTDVYSTLDDSEIIKEKKIEIISDIIEDYENKRGGK